MLKDYFITLENAHNQFLNEKEQVPNQYGWHNHDFLNLFVHRN